MVLETAHSTLLEHPVWALSVVNLYPSCLFLNTAPLITSLNTILLALSGFPFENKLFLWLMIFAMCSAIATMSGTYILTLEMVFPMLWSENLHVIVSLSLYVWIGVLCICSGASHKPLLRMDVEQVPKSRREMEKTMQRNENPSSA